MCERQKLQKRPVATGLSISLSSISAFVLAESISAFTVSSWTWRVNVPAQRTMGRAPFLPNHARNDCRQTFYACSSSVLQMIKALPGSGYSGPEDEEGVIETYEPMMQYPGSMRPGMTPENMPYQNLPCGDDDPEPIPWPNFQEQKWFHPYEVPEEIPMSMEEFIASIGRWATVEDEANMKAGTRRAVRLSRAENEADLQEGTGEFVRTDQADDDAPPSAQAGMGLARDISQLVGEDTSDETVILDDSEEEAEEDSEFGDFLLDLGLDAGGGDEDDGAVATTGAEGDADETSEELIDAMQNLMGREASGTLPVEDDDNLSLDLGLLEDDDDIDTSTEEDDSDESDNEFASMQMVVDDEEDDLEFNDDVQEVPLEDYSDSVNDVDDDVGFDDGGFDYDGSNDGGDFDSW